MTYPVTPESTPTPPVLFLDVDGVLNRCGKSNQGLEADKIDLLRTIIRETNCRVVLSSTWRLNPTALKRVEKEIFIHDVTPDLGDKTTLRKTVPRGREIAAWLKENKAGHFVILDDDNDMEELSSHLVRTESYTGLTREIAQEVIRRLSPIPIPP
jgi:hypothetical protein